MAFEEWARTATIKREWGTITVEYDSAKAGWDAMKEEALTVLDGRCKYMTRRCDPELEMECVACGAAAAIRALGGGA